MSAQQTEFKETNSTPLVATKPESLDDKQTNQGLRGIFHQHPMAARAAALLLFAVVIVGGGLFLWNSLARESTDDAQVNGHVMPLSARINGYVLKVPVIEGQLVQAGDVLVTIDPKDYEITLEQARPMLEAARARAESLPLNVLI